MMQKNNAFARVFNILVYAFLYLPIVVLIIFSFNASKSRTVWAGFSLQWYQELLRDEENSTATNKEKIFIAKPEQVDWSQVEHMLTTLQTCLDQKGDIRQVMHDLLPSFKKPEEVNGDRAQLPKEAS